MLVHGGWTDHTSWQLVVPDLAASRQVLTYDRRGHSRSERPDPPASRRTHEDDLVALVEALDLGPALLVGNSYGASIALGVAARRPDLVRAVSVHEPPLVDAVAPGAPLAVELQRVCRILEEVGDEVRRGEHESAACRFVEEVALGPGMWQAIPAESRRIFTANAPTILDLLDDPDWATVPVPDPAVPVMLTDGDASPRWLPGIVDVLATTAYRHAGRHTFGGAGHVPHLTHAGELVSVIGTFDGRSAAVDGPVGTARRGRP